MLNKVMIIGKLGRDPELRYTTTGTPVTTLSVATNESFLDRDGNRQERTEWHRVTVFQKQAENCAHFLAKGSLVYVEGTLQTRKWQDQQGMDRYTTEIRAQRVQFLDRKSDRRSQSGWGQGGYQGGGQGGYHVGTPMGYQTGSQGGYQDSYAGQGFQGQMDEMGMDAMGPMDAANNGAPVHQPPRAAQPVAPEAPRPAPAAQTTPDAATRDADLGAPGPSESFVDEVPF